VLVYESISEVQVTYVQGRVTLIFQHYLVWLTIKSG